MLSTAQRTKIRRLSAPEATEAEEGKEINVVPFLDIITNVLMFVLATIAVTFTSTVDVAVSKPSVRAPSDPVLGLTVVVVGDGFGLKASGGNVMTGCEGVGAGLAIPKHDGAYDYTALRGCATKLKASNGTFASEQSVTVTASADVPYQVVIATVDALRTSNDGHDLFPEVAFGVAR